jgi:hypothetical protein
MSCASAGLNVTLLLRAEDAWNFTPMPPIRPCAHTEQNLYIYLISRLRAFLSPNGAEFQALKAAKINITVVCCPVWVWNLVSDTKVGT